MDRDTFCDAIEKATDEIIVPWNVVAIPMWNCEDERNPIGFCAYDKFNDPALDSCVFCGDPYERK